MKKKSTKSAVTAAASMIESWLEEVANNPASMTQRKLARVEAAPGGLRAAKKVARRKGVHLLLIEDDKGSQVVAASTKPFKVLA